MLKRINETMQVRMTLEEANEYNELVERNKAMPIRIKTIGESTFEVCPVCSRVIGKDMDFCGKCGQRIDKENTAF